MPQPTPKKSSPPAPGDWVYVEEPTRIGVNQRAALVKALSSDGVSAIVEYLVGAIGDVVPIKYCRVYRRFGDAKAAAEQAEAPAKAAGVPLGKPGNPVLVHQTHFKRCRHVTYAPQPELGQTYRITGYLDIGDWCPTCKPLHPRKKVSR